MSKRSYKKFRLSKNNPIRPIHGSIKLSELRALGLAYEDILDFSTNINPLGPPESVFDGVEDIDLSKYPDPECLHLHEMISKHLDIDTSFILAGSWRNRLLQKGIVVRDCTSFGLPDYIRIGIRPFSECRQLVNTMMELVEV
ncbi:MAG: hypothetical protein CL792_06445 [Chloroflexi bacterium]|nr:hypothetical protein [Chloroflexota bacterium]|tara:strand:+ start:11907 stop:12332 length:426 start_codon:yes stop_codon:yes gene_type:complete